MPSAYSARRRAGLLAMAAVAGALTAVPTAQAAAPAVLGTRDVTAYVWAGKVNVRWGPNVWQPALGQVGPGNVSARCQTPGDQVTYGRYTNYWWALITIPGSGEMGYISDVFIRGGNNNEPVPGVPIC
ncbi:hypothetical protein CP973_22740 [Streptomyces albofaciens JCM 4342]|uniref:hypothetical protein n=1 Tax=Streptomyces albofaciens TaxID=66866 RepID=UPI001239DAE7|nr:hypothetical protein [Streptomyces albofaciens]KAA6212259.1 hypothetical protein CP973_22740 [Streptomyces albofaciens JCM 4342]